MAILSTLKSTTLDETIRCTSKWFILTSKMQNMELVNLKCVSNAQPIPLSLKCIFLSINVICECSQNIQRTEIALEVLHDSYKQNLYTEANCELPSFKFQNPNEMK